MDTTLKMFDRVKNNKLELAVLKSTTTKLVCWCFSFRNALCGWRRWPSIWTTRMTEPPILEKILNLKFLSDKIKVGKQIE
jgi:hypothetical protein